MTESTQAVSTAEKPSARSGGRGINVAIVVAAIVTALGIVLWMIQLSGGLVQTGMRNLDSWGLYITMFMFLVGLSAGGLIISSIPNAFGINGFGGISKIAIWTSICCTVLAIGFVVVDLGQPLRLWELFVFANFNSPLIWDIIILGTYLILSIIYLAMTLRYEAGKTSHVTIRVLSVIALIVAVLVHSVTAWIFGLQQGREMWHTALLAPWFVSSALVCGTALVIVVVEALRKSGYMELEQSNIVRLVMLLGAFVCVDLYFFGCDLVTEAFPLASGLEIVKMLVGGQFAPFFWIEVLGCIACIIVCFTPKLRSNTLIVIVSLLVIVGIFCKRALLLVGGFQVANLTLPGVFNAMSITNWQDGLAGAYAGLVYWPQPIEFGIVLGVIGLGALMLLLGLKHLPLKPAANSH